MFRSSSSNGSPSLPITSDENTHGGPRRDRHEDSHVRSWGLLALGHQEPASDDQDQSHPCEGSPDRCGEQSTLHQFLNKPVHQDHLGHGEVGRRPRAMTCPGVEEEDDVDNVQYQSQYKHDDLLATSHCSQFHPCTLGTAVRRTLQM